MKIDECYIDLIKQGIKVHEYRLATSERRKIKINDILYLESRENPSNSIEVIVEDIEIFDNWYLALNNTWESDFKNLYSSFDVVLKKCQSFYSIEEVNNYGIIVFKIKY